MFYTFFPLFPTKTARFIHFLRFWPSKGPIIQTKDMVLAKSLYAFIFSLYDF